MYYYYDVLLNFQDSDKLYEFYEWEETDEIDFIKKIPLFKISSKTLKDLIKYQVIFETEFLNEIKKKTVLKSSSKELEYAFLVSDTKNALALELNTKGEVINRSKLLLSDEINLSEIMFTMKEIKLPYSKKEKYPAIRELRQIENIKKLIKCEIDTLYESKNISKLKYLYFEWFNEYKEELDEIIKGMYKDLEENYSVNQKHIYEIIKHSYNKVN